MAWDLKFDQGVWLPQIEWWLDSRLPVARSFVSHAHFDHVAAHREILCSPGTARLMRARLPAERIEHVLPFGQTEQLTPDCTVSLHPAGHIFGSAQSLLTHPEHGRLLYTGDFKLRPGLSAEPCATPSADVLIMETTFGRPQYVFPPTAEVLADIQRFCRAALQDGDTPVLFGYSLGKSQELLSSLASAQLPVMLHPATYRLTKVYEELGLSFPPYREFLPAELTGHVVICPPLPPGSAFLKKMGRRRTAVITGWALDSSAIYRYQCDAAFPLSDHADFPDLLRFVELVQPKQVFTLHGFALEFARTLRDRGVEAWAIGQANQLDLGIAGVPSVAATGYSPEADFPSVSPDEGDGPGSFARFAVVANRIKATASKREKIALLASYLGELSVDDAAHAVLFFSGRAFSQAEDRTLNLGWAVLKRAVLEVAGSTEPDLRAAYRRFADSGDASAAILLGKTQPRFPTLAETAAFFDQAATARGPAAKLELTSQYLRGLTPDEARYFIKIITGDLRIGLKETLVEEAVALACVQPLPAVREANMLSGDLAEVVRAARLGQLEQIQLRVFHPLQFMLASPEPTAAAILERLTPPVWLEEKYDGIRCQLHKQGGRVELYSRDLHRITAQFPDLVSAAAGLTDDFVGDGELLAWRDGRALPFAELQKRLGRKGDDFFLGGEIPVSISFYDLLWRNGRVLLKEPLHLRRSLLAAVLAGAPPAFSLAPIQRAAFAWLPCASSIAWA